MITIHLLPRDVAAGRSGDTAWFERYSDFIQDETLRQVLYKRLCQNWGHSGVGRGAHE